MRLIILHILLIIFSAGCACGREHHGNRDNPPEIADLPEEVAPSSTPTPTPTVPPCTPKVIVITREVGPGVIAQPEALPEQPDSPSEQPETIPEQSSPEPETDETTAPTPSPSSIPTPAPLPTASAAPTATPSPTPVSCTYEYRNVECRGSKLHYELVWHCPHLADRIIKKVVESDECRKRDKKHKNRNKERDDD